MMTERVNSLAIILCNHYAQTRIVARGIVIRHLEPGEPAPCASCRAAARAVDKLVDRLLAGDGHVRIGGGWRCACGVPLADRRTPTWHQHLADVGIPLDETTP